jgi:hypothetical protein
LVRVLIPGQRTRALTALLAGALLLSLTFAMPASAAGPLKLTAGAADPDAAPAGSVFSFAATYISKDDDPPAFVRVIVDGKAHAMRPINASDSDMRDGARYRVRFKIKVPGTYAYSFAAQDSKGRATSLAGGTFKVTKPKPKPTPTPRPAATNDPKRTPKPAATASPPTDGQSSAGAAAGLFLDYDGGPGSGGPGGSSYPPGWSGWPAAVSPIGGPDGGAGEHGPAPQGPGSTAGHRTVGAIAALAVTLPGYGSDAWLALAARSALIAAGTAAIVAMALFTFRRRRPDDEDPDDGSSRDEEPAESPAGATPTQAALTGEMAMPRWRRPSLNEARKAPPGTSLEAIEAERLTFARGAVVAGAEHERRRIRYRMVRLSDSPDDLLGQEIGRLDEGDEVELLERSGLYWHVRTPAGQIGWVHKMTLGDVVTSVEPSIPDDDADADDDVLAAFTEAQARRAASTQAEPVMGEGLAARFIREHGAN